MTTHSKYPLAALAVLLALGTGAGAMAAPASAAQSHAQDARATTALNLMEAHDYSRFRDFRADGQKFSAVAILDNGKTVRLEINPDSGQIVTF
jgi:hypothetical protein